LIIFKTLLIIDNGCTSFVGHPGKFLYNQQDCYSHLPLSSFYYQNSEASLRDKELLQLYKVYHITFDLLSNNILRVFSLWCEVSEASSSSRR
jgi:hypothetical protein